jgi:chromosome segregation ATPase
MTPDDGEPQPDRLLGLPLDEAVDAVVDERDDADTDEVRRALSHVAEDGVVTVEAVEEAQAHVAKVVSTPESRVEFASLELSEAREAAEPFADLDTVAAQLDAFEHRLATVKQWVSELGPELRSVARSHPETAVYETAVRTRALTEEANAAQRAADELYVDIEAFERWLADADVRYESLGEDLDALDDSLDRLADAATSIDTAAPADRENEAVDWFDATLRHRVLEPLFADLRADLADLRSLAERDAAGVATGDDGSTVDAGRLDDLEARLDDLETRWRTIGDRLAGGAHDAWRARFDERLATFETALTSFDPPIDWEALQAELDAHRERPDGPT